MMMLVAACTTLSDRINTVIRLGCFLSLGELFVARNAKLVGSQDQTLLVVGTMRVVTLQTVRLFVVVAAESTASFVGLVAIHTKSVASASC